MPKIISSMRGIFLVVVTLLFGACGNTSQYNGYVTASNDAVRAVENGLYSAEATAQIAIVQNPDFNGGLIHPRALKKIQEYAITCQRQIDAQLAGALQSGASGATSYGIAGTGIGPGAELAFDADLVDYAIYGGVGYLLPGAVNGLVTGSYAMASAKGSCTQGFWEDVVNIDPDFHGTHVIVVYAGKKMFGSAPPALDQSAVPDILRTPIP